MKVQCKGIIMDASMLGFLGMYFVSWYLKNNIAFSIDNKMQVSEKQILDVFCTD